MCNDIWLGRKRTMTRARYLLLTAFCLLSWTAGGGCAPLTPSAAIPPAARVDLTATVEAERLEVILTALAQSTGPLLTPEAASGPTAIVVQTPPPSPTPAVTPDLTATAAYATAAAWERLPTNTPMQTLTPNATATYAYAIARAVATAQALGLSPRDVWINPVDGGVYVYVPSGEFLMGSAEDEPGAESDEKPRHTVYLDAYWIMQTETTSEQYWRCVEAGQCTAPDRGGSCTYGTKAKTDHPINCVSWEQAQAYCRWAGGRLPTEAEWEKAARGTDGRIYPWGDEWDASKANTSEGGRGDTTAVGAYPAGASPYGALDMAGNVWEWVADWYGEGYYSQSPRENPLGPASGTYRVVRGGSWGYVQRSVRAAYRFRDRPGDRYDRVGFRCARSD
jgi:formylglycine-generating enzyme required for sulfatase activity